MARVVVDANVLIAARLSRDQDHDQGREMANAFDRGELPTAIVLSDVLEEVLNYLQARSTHAVAVETLDALIESRGFELVYTPKTDFDPAVRCSERTTGYRSPMRSSLPRWIDGGSSTSTRSTMASTVSRASPVS